MKSPVIGKDEITSDSAANSRAALEQSKDLRIPGLDYGCRTAKAFCAVWQSGRVQDRRRTPKAFHSEAQGCEATLGKKRAATKTNPVGLHNTWNPFRVLTRKRRAVYPG